MTWGAPKWPPKPPDARKHPGTAAVLLVCGLRSRSGVPPDHPLDAALEHQLVTLVQHAMAERDDVRLGDGSPEGPVHGADRVLLERQALTDHRVILPGRLGGRPHSG